MDANTRDWPVPVQEIAVDGEAMEAANAAATNAATVMAEEGAAAANDAVLAQPRRVRRQSSEDRGEVEDHRTVKRSRIGTEEWSPEPADDREQARMEADADAHHTGYVEDAMSEEDARPTPASAASPETTAQGTGVQRTLESDASVVERSVRRRIMCKSRPGNGQAAAAAGGATTHAPQSLPEQSHHQPRQHEHSDELVSAQRRRRIIQEQQLELRRRRMAEEAVVREAWGSARTALSAAAFVELRVEHTELPFA